MAHRWLAKAVDATAAAVLAAGALVVTAGAAHASSHTWTWTGCATGSSDWQNQHNWVPPHMPIQGLPQTGDSVIVADPGLCTSAPTGIPAMRLDDLTVEGQGADLASGGPLTVTGSLTWSGGIIEVPLVLAGGSSSVIGGADGTSSASGESATGVPLDLNANITVDGTLTLEVTSSHGVTNAGVALEGGHAITIESDGTLYSSGANVISSICCAAPRDKLINLGTVDVPSDTLNLSGVEFDDTGTVHAASGATLRNTAGPVVLGPGATYSGSGRFLLDAGGDGTIDGTSTLGKGFHLVLADGSLTGPGTIAGAGTFDWTGGTLGDDDDDAVTIAAGANMRVSGANTGSSSRLLDGPLVDHGTVTVDQQANVNVTGGSVSIASDGVLILAPGTTVATQTCCSTPNDPITNHGGLLTVPAASGGVAPGTPALLGGISYDTSSTATTSVATGEVLGLDLAPNSLTGGTISGGGTVRLTGPTAVGGTLRLAGGTTVHLDSGGSLQGDATLTGSGALDWTGGSMAGNLTLAPRDGVMLSGAHTKTIASIGGGATPSAVRVDAPIVLRAGTAKHPDVLDARSSTMTTSDSVILDDHAEIASGTIVNTGALTVSPGAGGRVTIGPNATIVNRATVDVASGTLSDAGPYRQQRGVTEIAAGATLADGGGDTRVQVTGGTLTGAGIVDKSVDNSHGTVAPAPTVPDAGMTGVLTFGRTYTQGKAGTLAIEIDGSSPGTHDDRLSVLGTATLAGTLAVSTPYGYDPQSGATFRILTAGSRSGTFGVVHTIGLSCQQWHPTYARTGVGLAARPPFDDVPPSNPFCADITWLSAQHITGGYPDGGFHPTAPVTRQAMAAFLYRLENPGATPAHCATAAFQDVPPSNPFCGDIAWLKGQDITGGYPDGTFHPTATVSRQAMAAFLHRLEAPNDTGSCTSKPFPDVPTSNPFCGDIAWLKGQDITGGYPDGTFHPTATVSRQAMAAFLHRLVG